MSDCVPPAGHDQLLVPGSDGVQVGQAGVGGVLGELALGGLAGSEDEVADGVHDADEEEEVPGYHGVPVQEVPGDQGGQEGEGEVGGGQGPATARVQHVVGVEIILLEEHRVHGVEHLEGGSQDNGGVGFASSGDDRVSHHDNIEESQAEHGEPEVQQLHVLPENLGVEAASVVDVHNWVSSVALGVQLVLWSPEGHGVVLDGVVEGEGDAGDHDLEIVVADNVERNLVVNQGRNREESQQHG